MPDLEKQKLWDDRIQVFLASGQSQKAWCLEQGLPEHQLRYWLAKHKTRTSKNMNEHWVAMETLKFSNGSGVSLRMGNTILEIEHGFDNQVLADVLHVLMNLC